MLILSGILDAKTKMSVSEKRFSSYKDTQQQTYKVALYPMLTHHNMLAHCKQGLEWLVFGYPVVLNIFSDTDKIQFNTLKKLSLYQKEVS